MKTFLSKKFTDKIKSFNNKDYYYQNTLAQKCIELMEEEKSYLDNLENVLVYHENIIVPNYNFTNRSINIPLSYQLNYKNLYDNVNIYLNDKSSEYIISMK